MKTGHINLADVFLNENHSPVCYDNIIVDDVTSHNSHGKISGLFTVSQSTDPIFLSIYIFLNYRLNPKGVIRTIGENKLVCQYSGVFRFTVSYR